jgi:hypothetical protein
MNSSFAAAPRQMRDLRYRKTIKSAWMKWAMLGWAVVAFSPIVGHCADSLLDTTLEDTKLYFTAPLRWDQEDWLYFGGALAQLAPPTRWMTECAIISQPARRPF